VNDKIEDGIDRLLKWLDKHVTEQRMIGLQPIAIIVLLVALAWCVSGVFRFFH
jgi:hypothetical protein